MMSTLFQRDPITGEYIVRQISSRISSKFGLVYCPVEPLYEYINQVNTPTSILKISPSDYLRGFAPPIIDIWVEITKEKNAEGKTKRIVEVINFYETDHEDDDESCDSSKIELVSAIKTFRKFIKKAGIE